jgi:hypothetical protein
MKEVNQWESRTDCLGGGDLRRPSLQLEKHHPDDLVAIENSSWPSNKFNRSYQDYPTRPFHPNLEVVLDASSEWCAGHQNQDVDARSTRSAGKARAANFSSNLSPGAVETTLSSSSRANAALFTASMIRTSALISAKTDGTR